MIYRIAYQARVAQNEYLVEAKSMADALASFKELNKTYKNLHLIGIEELSGNYHIKCNLEKGLNLFKLLYEVNTNEGSYLIVVNTEDDLYNCVDLNVDNSICFMNDIDVMLM